MVTVGYIHTFNAAEPFCQVYYGFIVINNPHRVAHSLVGHKIIYWRMLRFVFFNKNGNFFLFAVCQKYGTGVCVAGVNMVYAVRFFVGVGEFVLFDNIVYVVINRNTADDARLTSAVHYLAVNIVAGFFILPAYAFCFKRGKSGCGFFVNLLRIRVCFGRKINFSLVNMEEGIRVAFSHFCRFVTVHNIIRQCRYSACVFGKRPDRFKRFYCCRIYQSFR